MNIKQIMTSIGITLFSFNALSSGSYRVNLGNLEINNATHKLPQKAILGNGWKQFDLESGNAVCVANETHDLKFQPLINSKTTGLSIHDGADNYPIFSTGIEGIGYAVGVRQKGTSRWYPLADSNSPINAVDGTSKLFLETKMMYVKTVQGKIEGKENAFARFDPLKVQCSGNLRGDGEIQPAPAMVTWEASTCEIKSARQSVNLGVHELAKVQALKVGDTFGYAQQSVTIDCPSQMSIFYTIADNFHPSNINTNIIYLENEGEKPGFAVQVFEAGKTTPLRLGGDRSLSSEHLYSLINTANLSQVVTKTFDFRYVKLSDNVKASDGNAQVTVTLVYK